MAMLRSAQDDARGQCFSALRTTRVGNAPRGRAFSFVAHPTSCVLRRDGLLPRVLPLNNAAIAAPPALLRP